MSGNDLTTRQRQVLLLIQRGKTNDEIGEALGIATATVKQHVLTIRHKLGVESKRKLIEIAQNRVTASS